MKIHYKLDAVGKVESYALVRAEATLPEGFLVAESESEFEKLTGVDLCDTTCDYSENKRKLASTDLTINRPLEDVILALIQAEIDLPAQLIEQVIDKQEKRNKFLGRKGVIVTKNGSCSHSTNECSSLVDAEVGYITEAQALSDGMSKCSKCN